jgi:hypothetical protein
MAEKKKLTRALVDGAVLTSIVLIAQLYLQSGLVSLPNMQDPMQALLPYAQTAAPGTTFKTDTGGKLDGVPVAQAAQMLPSSSDGLRFGEHEAHLQVSSFEAVMFKRFIL